MVALLSVLLILLILLSILALLLAGLYAYVFRRPLAQHSGTLSGRGLQNPVEVIRDRWGVPHIYAHDLPDLLFAQGYTHAQDRLWQMEFQRRAASGRLAEIFGRIALDADRFTRTLGFRRTAKTEADALDGETRSLLAAYCQGVNVFMESHRGRLPAEFTLLGIKPEPWTPEDTIVWTKLMGWNLSANWEAELVRAQLVAHLGPYRAAELEPNYPQDNPTIAPPGLHALDASALLLEHYERAKEWLGPTGAPLGSNNWVLDGQKSATGKPLLANDPHLAVAMPGIWYENHLVAGDFAVTGVSLPGVPFVVIGHNERVGWGMTATLPDNQDLFVERFDPSNPTLYQFRGDWEAARIYREVIRIRSETAPLTLEVRETRHGPVISDVVKSPVPLALSWTGFSPQQSLRAALRLNAARTTGEARAALSGWGVPVMNFVFADVGGNVGYEMAGAVPVRACGQGLVPAPGWTGEYEWAGILPNVELLRLDNPPEHFIATANNRVVGDSYPHFLTIEWSPGYRARRIVEMLSVKRRLTLADCQQMQLDVTSILGQEIAPYFTALEPTGHWERIALRALRGWDYRLDTESVGGAIYELCLVHLLDLVFAQKLGPLGEPFLGAGVSPLSPVSGLMGRAVVRLVELLSQESSPWFADAATGRERTRDEVLAEALRRAVRTLRETVGDEPRRWQWGRLHQVQFVHPLGTLRLFRSVFSRGPYPLGGDSETVNQAGYRLRPPIGMVHVFASYRQVLDFAAWDRSVAVHTTGQSGQPGHPHYADQLAMWREGEYHPMLWSRARIEENAEARLRLEPRSFVANTVHQLETDGS
ncbi:MAG: penicillin acylase family protein [Anaerolineae bacterium]|nr:penicillin acylase family protein [Anaerolineae bacterium]